MPALAIEGSGIWKNFRRYQEKNRYLKQTLLKGRRARYEEFWALKGVDLGVPRSSTYGIIGSNGSGKSTLLKCLTGILQPDKGTVEMRGSVAAMLELGSGFHPELSGRENVYLNGAILGMSKSVIEAKFDSIVDFAGIGEFIDSPVKNYSSGMAVRLGFSVAISVEPEIFIIDEVLAVGDASFQQRCFEKIEEFRSDGRTIVLVSHGLSQVTGLCSQVMWLDKGTVREVGRADDVVGHYLTESLSSEDSQRTAGVDRWGSREIEIAAVVLRDAHGMATGNFGSGEAMTIEVDVSRVAASPPALVKLEITHLHGVQIFSASSRHHGTTIPSGMREGTVTISVPRLPLLEGTYDLSVALTSESETHDFDHWRKCSRFTVHRNNIFDEGVVAVESTWDLSAPLE